MFKLEQIEGILPIRAEPGSASPVVPSLLHEALFGQLEDRASDSFAVLDGASVDGLPELLNASGMDHECLFRGQAGGK